MKNILYLTHSPILGGAELSLLSHLHYINKQEYHPVLLCSDVLAERANKIEGVSVITMNFYLLHRFNPFMLFNYIRMEKDVLKVIKRERIDIIHTNSVKAHYIGVLASLLSHKPLFLWMRDTTMNKFLYYVSYPFFKKNICISKYVSTYFNNGKKNIVIYNGTDIYKDIASETEKNATEEHLHLKDKIVILCSERLVTWKGVHILIEALAKIPHKDIACLILGTGKNQRDDIEFDLIKRAAELDLTNIVTFLGWRTDTAIYYQLASMLIHPVIEPEPFGLVVIEGMSFGLPVIATNIGGPAEIIQNEKDGLLIEPGNSDVLAQMITKLISTPSLREDLGASAKEKIFANFTQEIETKNIEEVYANVQ